MYAVGIMSGTSMDGIDTVLVDIHGYGKETKLKVIGYHEYPMPLDMKAKIMKACDEKDSHVDEICSLNFELGYLFVEAIKVLLHKYHILSKDIDFIATHGQTIYHIPFQKGQLLPSTLQIGEPAVLAYELNTTVISNFRVMDMAAGGQGAPLVPYSEFILYSEEHKNIALQNIGGIGNVTLLVGQDLDQVQAFDTGPGNMMINEACRLLYHLEYDDCGHISAKGTVINALLDELMHHSYMKKQPPKSTGREDFGEKYVHYLVDKYKKEKPQDIITTLTYFTAKSIAYHYQTYILPYYPLHKVIVGGGGSHNQTLLQMLQKELYDIPVYTQDDIGYSSDAKEAIAFVIMGNETLHHHFSNVKSATGASDYVILGNITLPPR